jgi:hypothetical protein
VETLLPAAGFLLAAFTVGFGARAALSEARRRKARVDRQALGPIDAEPSPAALRAERDVLAREAAQLGQQVDRLLDMLEHEQVLRRQLQDELVRSIERPFVLLDDARAENAVLRTRLASSERRYRDLKRVVGQLLRRLRSRGTWAQAA